MEDKNRTLVVFQNAKNSENSGVPKTICVFEHKKIRRTWFNDEWWFGAIDIVEALTDSKDPSGYLKDMRRRDEIFKNE